MPPKKMKQPTPEALVRTTELLAWLDGLVAEVRGELNRKLRLPGGHELHLVADKNLVVHFANSAAAAILSLTQLQKACQRLGTTRFSYADQLLVDTVAQIHAACHADTPTATS